MARANPRPDPPGLYQTTHYIIPPHKTTAQHHHLTHHHITQVMTE